MIEKENYITKGKDKSWPVLLNARVSNDHIAATVQ